LLRRCIAQLHAARVVTILAAVDALIRGGRASLTALGRNLAPSTTPKHRIKRIDRLLGNAHLHRELFAWYAIVAARLLDGCPRPVILIDWTEINRSWWSLTAAVPVAGRAIPIYSEVHPPSGNGSARLIERFMKNLRRVLPSSVRPTLVADAGFMRPFFEACWQCRFDLVVRLNGHGRLRAWCPDRTTTVHAIACQARRKARCLGDWKVYDANRRGVTLRVVSAKRTGLLHRIDDRSYRKRAVEPWTLGTTRHDLTPEDVIALYAMRMRIEEMFRDAKNARFGWSLAHSATTSAARLEVLLLISTLAMFAVILVGSAADQAGCTRFLQANTTRRRAVLSLFRIGCLMLSEFGDSWGSRRGISP